MLLALEHHADRGLVADPGSRNKHCFSLAVRPGCPQGNLQHGEPVQSSAGAAGSSNQGLGAMHLDREGGHAVGILQHAVTPPSAEAGPSGTGHGLHVVVRSPSWNE